MASILEEYIGKTTGFIPGTPVPNKFPMLSGLSYRIAIIGEAPGRDEEVQGEPFVGMSGRMLNALLAKAGISRAACFIGNICQHRPPNNDISAFARDGDEIQTGLITLYRDLEKVKPNICLLLGKTALWAFKGVDNIGNWRGSVFLDAHQYKCLASYHPAACLRQYDWTPLLMFDLIKCRREAESPTLTIPQRHFDINLSSEQTLEKLERLLVDKPTIAIDIEGYVDNMSCISIATSSSYAFIVPFAKFHYNNHYETPDTEAKTWRALNNVLSSPSIPKILQNSLYDRFVLQYSYGIIVDGVVGDTMLQHWELYCELEKSLGFQASLYTNEPFYKHERKSDDRDTFWSYCCRDSALTYEIHETIAKHLSSDSHQHYEFNISLLNPLLYMENRGIKYDISTAKERLKEINQHIYRLQYQLDQLANVGLKKDIDRTVALALIRDVMCYKRDLNQPKAAFAQDYDICVRYLLGEGNLTEEMIGHINVAAGWSMNIKSPTFKKYIYGTLKLPEQRHPITKELTVNYEALLKIQKKQPHRASELALEIGELRTRSQMLEISADKDQRVRCGYNVVGTETGRLTCYTSPTGSGYNLQTIPSSAPLRPEGHPLQKGMRDLFISDSGNYLFQCDLSGADGWTVAAHCASLGDSTMLDDYRTGIKPAKVLCYLLRHGASALSGKSRQEIKELTKSIEKDSWDYFACKIGQHGSCYLMGAQKLANQIFIQSEGKVNITTKEAEGLQKLFFIRYNVKIWHRWMQSNISKTAGHPRLTSASGHTRIFFGRRTELLGEMLAHEPQANTTYATNLAAWKLWNDTDNRMSFMSNTSMANVRLHVQKMQEVPLCNSLNTRNGKQSALQLRIEPLHQIHDAILGQFKISDTAWAVDKIKQWFNNEIVIAGQKITIPFEGQYGLNWAFDEKSKVGNIT